MHVPDKLVAKWTAAKAKADDLSRAYDGAHKVQVDAIDWGQGASPPSGASAEMAVADVEQITSDYRIAHRIEREALRDLLVYIEANAPKVGR